MLEDYFVIKPNSPRYSVALNTLNAAPSLVRQELPAIARVKYTFEGRTIAEITQVGLFIFIISDLEELSLGLIGAIYSGM